MDQLIAHHTVHDRVLPSKAHTALPHTRHEQHRTRTRLASARISAVPCTTRKLGSLCSGIMKGFTCVVWCFGLGVCGGEWSSQWVGQDQHRRRRGQQSDQRKAGPYVRAARWRPRAWRRGRCRRGRPAPWSCTTRCAPCACSWPVGSVGWFWFWFSLCGERTPGTTPPHSHTKNQTTRSNARTSSTPGM